MGALGRWVVFCVIALALFAGAADAAVKVLTDQTARNEEARRVESGQIEAIVEKLKALPPLPRGASAETHRRRALVIGNDAYEALAPLKKAIGDARTVSATLTDLGFAVTTLNDLDVDRFDSALGDFYASLEEGDVAFFYYSGHGVADGDNNYLLPIDMPKLAEMERRALDRKAIDASEVVAEIKGRGVSVAFVVLDACRDDPFALETGRSAAPVAGLARMKPTEGAFVIYSAGIRQEALDRLGPDDASPNSVFTRKFSPILETPGLPIVEIAKRTQVDVKALAATVGHVQTPAYYDQVVGQFYLRPPKPKLYGLTIGIDVYGGKRELEGAVNDAEEVARALEALGANEVVRIYDGDARRNFVAYVWKSLVERASPGDTIVFHYAGSSSNFPALPGSEEADGRQEFLLMAGSGMKDLMRTGVTETHPDIITDDVLTQWMAMAADRNINVTLVVDGCHGGGLLDREFANVSFIGASTEDQYVGEYVIDGRKHGIVSDAFAKGILGAADFNGDGFVSQSEIFAFVRAKTLEGAGVAQTPQFLPPPQDATASLALFELPADVAERSERIAKIAWPDSAAR